MSLKPFLALSRLRQARLLAGLTLSELARRSGVNTTKLGQAERHANSLTRGEMRVVSQALGADPSWLFADADTPTPAGDRQ